jgi:adenylate cyclase
MQAEDGSDPGGMEAADADSRASAERLRQFDETPWMLRAAKLVREFLPGDDELGDPLSTAGDKPSHLLARRLAEASSQRPSVARELGLGALQVWQALSEAQGRGLGDRDVAILFTDLVDFSSWALKVGDEATLELLRRVGTAEEGAVAAHGGQVVKRIGDGMMAVFDDPRGAVEAAHQACSAVGRLEVRGYHPKLRAGMHFGRPRRIGGDYVGVDVNIAARVAAAARGDEVLVSAPGCAQLTDGSFRLRQRRFKAKGAPKELQVFAVEPA